LNSIEFHCILSEREREREREKREREEREREREKIASAFGIIWSSS